jgi:hypothetical protein
MESQVKCDIRDISSKIHQQSAHNSTATRPTAHNLVTKILTGQNTLRRHLYLMWLIDSPLCRRCVAEEKTSAHVLGECEDLSLLRHTYLDCSFGSRGC